MTSVHFGVAYVVLIVAKVYVDLRFIILMCGNMHFMTENSFLSSFRNIWTL